MTNVSKNNGSPKSALSPAADEVTIQTFSKIQQKQSPNKSSNIMRGLVYAGILAGKISMMLSGCSSEDETAGVANKNYFTNRDFISEHKRSSLEEVYDEIGVSIPDLEKLESVKPEEVVIKEDVNGYAQEEAADSEKSIMEQASEKANEVASQLESLGWTLRGVMDMRYLFIVEASSPIPHPTGHNDEAQVRITIDSQLNEVISSMYVVIIEGAGAQVLPSRKWNELRLIPPPTELNCPDTMLGEGPVGNGGLLHPRMYY